MDIVGVASLSTALSQAQTGDAVSTLVLRKAMEIQAASALQLLQAVPQPSNPPNLGQTVDVRV